MTIQLVHVPTRDPNERKGGERNMRKAQLHYIKYAVTTLSTVGFAALAVKST